MLSLNLNKLLLLLWTTPARGQQLLTRLQKIAHPSSTHYFRVSGRCRKRWGARSTPIRILFQTRKRRLSQMKFIPVHSWLVPPPLILGIIGFPVIRVFYHGFYVYLSWYLKCMGTPSPVGGVWSCVVRFHSFSRGDCYWNHDVTVDGGMLLPAVNGIGIFIAVYLFLFIFPTVNRRPLFHLRFPHSTSNQLTCFHHVTPSNLTRLPCFPLPSKIPSFKCTLFLFFFPQEIWLDVDDR